MLHISLLIGCVHPLWVHQLLQYETTSKSLFTQSDCEPINLLPYIGVITLGMGDFVGGLGGLTFLSPTRWPGGSLQTLDGSFCMFLSMICSIGSFLTLLVWNHLNIQAFVLTLTLLTLTEASTRQINSLCLPVVASTFLILMAIMPNDNVT